jgi:hypothetical protein
MRVVLTFAGREAAPVRAISFLTHWNRWTLDVLAMAFAGTVSIATMQRSSQRIPVRRRSLDPAIGNVVAELCCRPVGRPGRAAKVAVWALCGHIRRVASPSASHPPRGGYVWLDDFEQLHDRDWMRRFRVWAPFACGCSSPQGESELLCDHVLHCRGARARFERSTRARALCPARPCVHREVAVRSKGLGSLPRSETVRPVATGLATIRGNLRMSSRPSPRA